MMSVLLGATTEGLEGPVPFKFSTIWTLGPPVGWSPTSGNYHKL